MKPPFSYYGGKQRMSSKIVPLIPKHTVYVEPFAGGAAVFFAKPWPEVSNTGHYREVLNDSDGRIINFYRCLRDPETSGRLLEMLSLTPYSEAEHAESARILREGADPLKLAWAFYVNISMSFSNKLLGGWGRGVYGRNLAVTWANKIARLPEYLGRMSAVHISDQDALKCIEQWDSPQTFFYCDPPYPDTHQGHYAGYSQADFERLVQTLNRSQGSFLLSCYPNAAVPSDWERLEFQAALSASGRGKVRADRSCAATAEELGDRCRIETVWRRLAPRPPRPEIQALYASGKFDCFV